MKNVIGKYVEVFKVKKVKVMNKIEFENNPLIIYLPEGAGYVDEESLNKETFSKIKIEFEIYKEQEVFSICIDDFLYIGTNGKMIDDEEKKARFGKTQKKKDGTVMQDYSSIYARAMMVAAKICEGKIKLSS